MKIAWIILKILLVRESCRYTRYSIPVLVTVNLLLYPRYSRYCTSCILSVTLAEHSGNPQRESMRTDTTERDCLWIGQAHQWWKKKNVPNFPHRNKIFPSFFREQLQELLSGLAAKILRITVIRTICKGCWYTVLYYSSRNNAPLLLIELSFFA